MSFGGDSVFIAKLCLCVISVLIAAECALTEVLFGTVKTLTYCVLDRPYQGLHKNNLTLL